MAVFTQATPKKKQKRERPEDDDDTSPLDPTWPIYPLVRGIGAIMLGGDPRGPNRERLERTFELGSLEWPRIDGARRVEAIVERIRGWRYGLVLVLRAFVLHKQADPIVAAAKSANVPWALVDGYGVAAIRLGLERFFGSGAPTR